MRFQSLALLWSAVLFFSDFSIASARQDDLPTPSWVDNFEPDNWVPGAWSEPSIEEWVPDFMRTRITGRDPQTGRSQTGRSRLKVVGQSHSGGLNTIVLDVTIPVFEEHTIKLPTSPMGSADPECYRHEDCGHGATCGESTAPVAISLTLEYQFTQQEAAAHAHAIGGKIGFKLPAGASGEVGYTYTYTTTLTTALTQRIRATVEKRPERRKCHVVTVDSDSFVHVVSKGELTGTITLTTQNGAIIGVEPDLTPNITPSIRPEVRAKAARYTLACGCNDQNRTARIEVPANGGQIALVTAGGFAVELVNQTNRGTLLGSLPRRMLDAGGLNVTTMTSNLTPTSSGTVSGAQVLAAVGQGGSSGSTYTLAPGATYYWQTPGYQNAMSYVQNAPGYYANTPGYQNAMSYIQNAPGYYANTPGYQNSPLSGLPPSLVGPALAIPAVQQFIGVISGGSTPGSP